MKFWVDRREELKDSKAPGRTHALVIGTSLYRWLPKGDAAPPDPERKTLGLSQVDISATSALLFANWLRDHFQNPDAPLATIMLFITPSDNEIANVAGMKDVAADFIGTTRGKIMGALTEWSKLCRGNPAGVAVLYASGHGIQIPGSKEDAFILLEDFADDPMIFNYSIDVGSNRRAMVGPDMPQNQLYFADACRLPPNTPLLGLGTGAALPYDPSVPDKRSAPIYYSALSNTKALGVIRKGTFFMQALIECLNSLALSGPNKKSAIPLERDKWHVSVPELLSPLDQRVKELAIAKSQELAARGINVDFPDQGVTMGGEARAAVFHALSDAPKVKLTLEVDPDSMAANAKAALWAGKQQIGENRDCRPKPCEFGEVDAGLYSLDIIVDGKKVAGAVVQADPPQTVFPYQL
ncbi:MAG TPA: caspase family protein [Bryobacteraceae bacterium]|nr:caspase family protein [Bryobacteraceae bacterium]